MCEWEITQGEKNRRGMDSKGIVPWLRCCFLQKPELITDFLSLVEQGQRRVCGIMHWWDSWGFGKWLAGQGGQKGDISNQNSSLLCWGMPWQKCDCLWTEFCREGGWVSLCYPLEVSDVYNAAEARILSCPCPTSLLRHSSFSIETRQGGTWVTGRTNLWFFRVPRNLPILHYWALLGK